MNNVIISFHKLSNVREKALFTSDIFEHAISKLWFYLQCSKFCFRTCLDKIEFLGCINGLKTKVLQVHWSCPDLLSLDTIASSSECCTTGGTLPCTELSQSCTLWTLKHPLCSLTRTNLTVHLANKWVSLLSCVSKHTTKLNLVLPSQSLVCMMINFNQSAIATGNTFRYATVKLTAVDLFFITKHDYHLNRTAASWMFKCSFRLHVIPYKCNQFH